MTKLEHVDVVRDALDKAWPGVRDGIAYQIARAGKAKLVGMNRRVVEQTLWVLSRADMLLTPEHTAVFERAREWARLDQDIAATDEQLNDIDEQLLQAVEALPE